MHGRRIITLLHPLSRDPAEVCCIEVSLSLFSLLRKCAGSNVSLPHANLRRGDAATAGALALGHKLSHGLWVLVGLDALETVIFQVEAGYEQRVKYRISTETPPGLDLRDPHRLKRRVSVSWTALFFPRGAVIQPGLGLHPYRAGLSYAEPEMVAVLICCNLDTEACDGIQYHQ